MSKLMAKVSKGTYKDTPLYAHKNEAGRYIASPSRFEVDYIYVDNEDELEALVLSGLKARMSNSEIPNAPSLITPKSIQKVDGSKLSSDPKNFLPKFSDEVDLDYDSKSKSRKEQALLRLHLTQGKDEAKCTICGDVYPTDFLIAAHIKPRLLCEKSEKLDFDNIAALMCKTGSDDLFEKGYIIICDGIVIDNSKQKKTTPKLKNLIDQLAGKKVSNWVGSFKYYIAHKEYHNGKSKKSAK
ncbi:hypothetical protein [Acinetobacter shaoyimingii]|uniref:HNH endonuclease n=1 Tax=Acinetobacter shaoyimingii TaxID=2715164 RepID=A0A6G8RXV8_9GAMM|nr:hypothetical protein [Acinetobacter shaoyimingii]QIO06638.1 hypothetical protein G8E00_12100 [Acinetobacter shaoyimingii]